MYCKMLNAGRNKYEEEKNGCADDKQRKDKIKLCWSVFHVIYMVSLFVFLLGAVVYAAWFFIKLKNTSRHFDKTPEEYFVPPPEERRTDFEITVERSTIKSTSEATTPDPTTVTSVSSTTLGMNTHHKSRHKKLEKRLRLLIVHSYSSALSAMVLKLSLKRDKRVSGVFTMRKSQLEMAASHNFKFVIRNYDFVIPLLSNTYFGVAIGERKKLNRQEMRMFWRNHTKLIEALTNDDKRDDDACISPELYTYSVVETGMNVTWTGEYYILRESYQNVVKKPHKFIANLKKIHLLRLVQTKNSSVFPCL